MIPQLRGPARLLRWAALGGASMGLAAAGHLVGGGTLPEPVVLVTAAGLVGLVALTVTARRVRLPVLLGVLGIEQVLLHALFTAATVGPGCPTPAVGPDHLSTLGTHALLTCGATPVGGPAMSPGTMTNDGSSASSWLMLAAHVLATLATAWVLARGEAWLWRLVDRVAAAAGRPRAGRRRSRQHLFLPPAVAAVGRLQHTPAAPRGPPVLLSVASSRS